MKEISIWPGIIPCSEAYTLRRQSSVWMDGAPYGPYWRRKTRYCLPVRPHAVFAYYRATGLTLVLSASIVLIRSIKLVDRLAILRVSLGFPGISRGAHRFSVTGANQQ